jgi:RES domain-containing protein
MLLWRLSSARRAADFDGGFGLFNDGRWNTRGRPVTYCATEPSLAALEKRVHVADPALLPPQVMVAYDVPDGISVRRIEIDELPANWVMQQTGTQRIGDRWLDAAEEMLLSVPSVIVPLVNAPDRNILVNHRVANISAIRVEATMPFTLDPRLFRP